ICSGQTTALTLSSPASASATFSWTVTQAGVSGASNSVGSSSSINQTLTLTGIPAGTATYSVVAAANGCQGNPQSIVVNVAPLNTASAPSSNPTVCLGASISPAITITTTGATGIGLPINLPVGVSASWSANTITISGTPSSAGTFAYSIPLVGGCGAVAAAGTITIISSNTAGPPSTSPILCLGTAINPAITISTTGATGIGTISGLPPGTSASWSTNSITIVGTPTTAGIFNYNIELLGGCGNVFASGTITVNPRPTVANVSTQSCSGNAFNVIPTSSAPNVIPAGTTYTWSAPVVTGGITGGAAGSGSSISGTLVNPGTTSATAIYSVTATSGTAPNQCSNTFTVTVTVNPTLTPTFNPVGPFCSGATIAALPTTSLNNVIGTWTPAINNTTTTTYTFNPNSGQCATTTTLTITITPNVTPTFAAVGPYCSGATIPALPTTSSNGITGTWSPAISNTTTTTYTFTP
ncbi:MAG: PKD-like domain-containing protein, partial [Flavobacteriales bacterium]